MYDCKIRTGLGKDSHRFLSKDSAKPCILGGIIFENTPGLATDSDGDVILHAICNAITSLTGVPILRKIAVDLRDKDGITDSRIYLEKALETLKGERIVHVALSVEGKRPCMQEKIDLIRKKVAEILWIDFSQVGITITSGDGLTDFSCGDGLQCLCLLTTMKL